MVVMTAMQQREKRDRAVDIPAGDDPMTSALRDVEAATALLRAMTSVIEDMRERSIGRALDADATWAQLGRALGISAQAAHKRYRDARPGSPDDDRNLVSGVAGESSLDQDLDQLVAVRIAHLAELISRTTQAVIEIPFSLKQPELRVLRLLGHEALTVTELSQRGMIDKAGVSRAVRSLTDRGIISRVSPDTGHGMQFRLTPAGDDLLTRLAAPSFARQRSFLGGLPQEPVNLILDELIRNAEQSATELTDDNQDDSS